ncbi:ABC transporter substrate-binding protein [Bradyrhizobium cosmicum]|uniref:ABC transporter substrate-binding protein n=1 Tax=Bradyrhizobium cosmicum TaxID=1404864 RepID=UPI0028E487C3|nr:ABC transporter substrate-binding protein [Bradyrhizobium cosmicum]
MRRREFISLVGGAAVWPVATQAQQPKKIPKIGILWHAGTAEEEDALGFRPAMFAGFAELGYVSGKSARFEERYANEEAERFHSLAAELVRLKVDVLVAVTFPSASAAQRATSTIPVVFIGPSDPVGLKLVASLARPGGNLTGLSALATDLTAKRVELVKEAIPGVSRVALIYDPAVPNFKFEISESGIAAERLALSFEAFEARGAHDLEHVFAQLAGRGFGAVILGISPVISREKKRISDLALAHRLPVMGWTDPFVAAGALMSYGPNWPALFRAVPPYVDRILKGDNPAEMPVAQPTRFYLAFNLKTAKMIGVDLPQTMVTRADEVIE